MYKNNLVVAVKQNGKVLREIGDKVFLPFSSEYSLLIKNLNSKKVAVNISIDGDDVLSGNSLLVDSNSRTELDGFLKGCRAKNKFRFIKKTKQISDYRGDKEDDGLIRVEFSFEEDVPEVIYNYDICDIKSKEQLPRYTLDTNIYYTSSNSFSNIKLGSNCCTYEDRLLEDAVCSDNGITVKGSEINQKFNYGSIGCLGKKNVMVIRLFGKRSNGTVIKKARLTKTKLVCPTCGNKSRSSSKFCSNCGTFLR